MVGYPPAPPMQPRLAGFLIRTVAYLVDALLLSLVGGAFPYLFFSTGTPNGNNPGAAAGTPAGGASLLLSLLYFVLLWSNVGGGRTLGMRLFGLKVIDENGGFIGVGGAFVRWIGLWISFIVCFIGVLWVAGDARKQGWHDKLAHSLVVYV